MKLVFFPAPNKKVFGKLAVPFSQNTTKRKAKEQAKFLVWATPDVESVELRDNSGNLIWIKSAKDL